MMIGSPFQGWFCHVKLLVFGKIPCKSSPLKYWYLKTLNFLLNSTWNLPWVSTEWFVRFDANLSCTWPNQYAKYVLQTHRWCCWWCVVFLKILFSVRSPSKDCNFLTACPLWIHVYDEPSVRLSSGSMLIKFMAGNHSPQRHQTTWFSGTPSVQNDNFVPPFFCSKMYGKKKWCKRQWCGGVFRRWGPRCIVPTIGDASVELAQKGMRCVAFFFHFMPWAVAEVATGSDAEFEVDLRMAALFFSLFQGLTLCFRASLMIGII